MKQSFVYILKCSDESYYIGVTNNIRRRFREHQSGMNETAYTHSRRPVELAYCEEFTDIRVAITREKQLKGWSRTKKEALIKRQFETLPNLAKKKFGK
jgi:putative endonuclease